MERWKGAVFLPVGLGLLMAAAYAAWDTRRFIDHSQVVPGIVVAEPYGPHHPQISFTARDGEPRTYPQGGEVTQHIGDHVAVRYDPTDPQGSPSLDTFGALWGATLGLAGLGCVSTLTGGGLLFARPRVGGASGPRDRSPAHGDRRTPTQTHPSSADAAFEALCAHLPAFVREAFLQRAGPPGPPQSVMDMFTRVEQWLVSAGIAEGRGGYPGGRGKPGWTDYVKLQQTHMAIYRTLVDAFGPPSPAMAELFGSYERRFTAPERRMGDGYEPHVDDVAGRLIYSLPVDSSFVSLTFEFPIRERDLETLRHDSWRRALLGAVAHTVLQRSMIRGNPEVSELEFSRIVDAILYSPPGRLAAFVQRLNQEHNTSIEHYARLALERRTPNAIGSVHPQAKA